MKDYTFGDLARSSRGGRAAGGPTPRGAGKVPRPVHGAGAVGGGSSKGRVGDGKRGANGPAFADAEDGAGGDLPAIGRSVPKGKSVSRGSAKPDASFKNESKRQSGGK